MLTTAAAMRRRRGWRRRGSCIRGCGVLAHAESCGQSAALVTGFRAARGEWIATLDGDGQNDPADIPKLFEVHGLRMTAGEGLSHDR